MPRSAAGPARDEEHGHVAPPGPANSLSVGAIAVPVPPTTSIVVPVAAKPEAARPA